MRIIIFLRFLPVSGFSSEALISNNNHHIFKVELRGYVEFTVELISTFDESPSGGRKDGNFSFIYFDVNGNGKIDDKIDRYYSVGPDGNICAGFLSGSNSVTPCSSFKSDSRVFTYFSKSKIESRPHPIFKFLIPAGEIFSDDGFAYAVFYIHSNEKGLTSYPLNKGLRNFDNTIKIKK